MPCLRLYLSLAPLLDAMGLLFLMGNEMVTKCDQKLMHSKQQRPGLNTMLVLYNTNIVIIFAKREL